MKNKRIIIFLAAVALLVTGVLALSDNLMSPYVSFEEAKKNAEAYVQVIGILDRDTPIEQDEQGFSFILKNDSGDKMTVKHFETKPVNFEHAENAVVLGRFDKASDTFLADKVLVKCPSKYQKEG